MSRYLVVLDVDSTLIENEVIELLASHAGVEEHVARITDRAMRGEIDFAESLRERVATLAGLPISVFDQVRTQISVTPGATKLISTVHEHQGLVGVVSGGFHETLDPLANELSLDFWKANRLGVQDGLLTGHVIGQIVDAQTKADCLTKWAAENNIPRTHTVAIGDGANDLAMMAAAGLGIAFCAKAVVQDQADIAINQRDLSLALNYLSF